MISRDMSNEPIRVLLVDDDEDDYRIQNRLLTKAATRAYELDWVPTFDDALDAVRRGSYDIALVDYHIGARTGIELIEELTRQHVRVPCILLTGWSDPSIDLAAERAGAMDFLNKNQLDGTQLERSIRYVVVQARTLETLRAREQQLLHAQKMQAIARLSGGIAHDFNNLLTTMAGYTELALTQIPAGDPLREDMEEIQAAVKRAEALSKRLLMISQRQLLAPILVDMNDFVTSSRGILQNLLGDGFDVEVVPAKEPARMFIDPNQLEQLLLHLASNAREAMGEAGKLCVSVDVQSVDEPLVYDRFTIPEGRYVRLSVTDTGPGLDANAMTHLFEPFYTTRQDRPGGGLGLSIVYGIVKQSHGYIWVESRVGEGTTFRLYFSPASELDEQLLSPRRRRKNTGPVRILIVEDEASLRRLAARVLRKKGYEVVEAVDGVDALESLERESAPFDFVLSDVVMPRMSGSELARHVAKMDMPPTVILMSGYSDGILDDNVRATCTEVLNKPFTVTELIDIVTRNTSMYVGD